MAINVKVSRDNAASIQVLKELRDHYEGMKYGTYKSHFYKKVVPEYMKILKSYGKKEAQKISRTGELQSHIITRRGKATRGYLSVWLGADGPAAKYASIINEGGWQKPRFKEHLTIPLDAAKDSTGAKKKSVRDYPKRMTFLWDIPASKAGTWGKLAGQKVLFKKERNYPFYGKGSRKKRDAIFKRGEKSKGVHFHKITPIFIYAKENYVRPTHWATNAMSQSMPEAIKLIKKYNEWFAKRGRKA